MRRRPVLVAVRATLRPDPAVRTLADGLAYWIRGNIDWSRETGRYAPPGENI